MSEKPGLFGAYRGGTYTRAYLTTFWLMAVVALGLQLWALQQWAGMVVLAGVAAVVVALLLGVPQTRLGPDGVTLVLLRQHVPWSQVVDAFDPQPGETELRLCLDDGTVLTAKGVPPSLAPAVRAHLGTSDP